LHPLGRIAEALRKRDLRAADYFGKFDTNNNSRISIKEFRKGIADLGLPMQYEDIKKIMFAVDEEGNADGFVSVTEIEKALRKAERAGRPSRSQSIGTLFPIKEGVRRRGTVAVPPQGTAESLTSSSSRQARSVTPTRTVKRKSVTGSPDDTRQSLLRHTPEDQLITDEVLQTFLNKPRTEYVRGDMRPSLFPEVPSDMKWDGIFTKPLRLRSHSCENDTGQEAKLSGVALDTAAVAALQNERERRVLLALEENVISGLQDSSIDRIELTTPIPKDLQGLVQNLADYYGLQYEVGETPDQDTVNMILLRTPDSRIRSSSLAKMCEEKDKDRGDGEGSAGQGADQKASTPRSKNSKDDVKRPSGGSKNSKEPAKSTAGSNPSKSPRGTPRSSSSKK